jgi:hypothetical protein
VVTPYIGGTAQTVTKVTGSPPSTSVTINGLNPAQAYTFSVHASNPNGNGPESPATSPVTPLGTSAPSAPTSVSVVPAGTEALVSWMTPTSNGGSPITGYTVTPFIGSSAQTPVQASASQNSATVSGLTNGTGYTFKVTATNAVGSTDSAPSDAITPSDTLFDLAVPASLDSNDPGPIDLGVGFTSSVAGQVTGIRFYKAATNTGTHIGSLWSSTGQLLASATFTNESATGWQTVLFSQPVTITPGTSYVASYYAPNGHYSFTSAAFSTAVTHGPLQALADGATPNGLYGYVSANAFPNSGFNATNYWVDVLFLPS